jgi:zinc transport system permease protein
MQELLSIFDYTFMQRALFAGVVIGVIAPLIGMYLVTRGYSLMADTLSHVALAGVAIGVLFGTAPIPMAIAATVLAAIGIQKLGSQRQIFGESVLAIFLSGSLAIAIVLMSLSQGMTIDLLSYLFGSITTVSSADVWTIGVLGLVIVGIVAVRYRQLFLVSFDSELAESQGVRADFYELLVVIMAAVTVAISMRIVGVLLIGALMVMPTLSGMLLGRGFFRSHMIAVAISVSCVILGIVLSYLLGTATGGTIVVCALICFLLSIVAARK